MPLSSSSPAPGTRIGSAVTSTDARKPPGNPRSLTTKSKVFTPGSMKAEAGPELNPCSVEYAKPSNAIVSMILPFSCAVPSLSAAHSPETTAVVGSKPASEKMKENVRNSPEVLALSQTQKDAGVVGLTIHAICGTTSTITPEPPLSVNPPAPAEPVPPWPTTTAFAEKERKSNPTIADNT